MLELQELLERHTSFAGVAATACLIKILSAPDWPTTTALFILVIYIVNERNNAIDAPASMPELKPIYEKIDELTLNQKSVADTVAETKKLLSQANLALGFKPRKTE